MNDPLPPLLDPYAGMQRAIEQMLLTYQDLFVPTGYALFSAFAVILVTWFGLQTALGAGERHGGLPMAALARFILALAIGYALITYYHSPIPGIGYSLPGLIRAQVGWLVSELHTTAARDLIRAIDDCWYGTEPPAFLDLVGGLIYCFFGGLCGVMKFAVFFVITFSFIATAILIVLGPLFIPFYIVPDLDFLFWSWLRSFLVYAFYQVIAEVYVTVWASFLLHILEPFRAGFSGAHLITLFTYVVMIFLAFIVGFLKVPSLTASLFAGRGGESIAGSLTFGALALVRGGKHGH